MISTFDTSSIGGTKKGKSILPALLVIAALAATGYYFYNKSQEAKRAEANERD